MSKNLIEVYPERSKRRQRLMLHVYRYDPSQPDYRHLMVDTDWMKKGTHEAPPSEYQAPLRLNPQEAQRLFDRLWGDGYRPSDGSDPDGVVAAKDAHIEDLRRVAFGQSGDDDLPF